VKDFLLSKDIRKREFPYEYMVRIEIHRYHLIKFFIDFVCYIQFILLVYSKHITST
jgi:hypothetical protein